MSFLRKKLNSYPHNLSFDCELWGWLQSKRNYNGMKVPLSAVVTRYLREAMAKDLQQKPVEKSVEIKKTHRTTGKNPTKKPIKQQVFSSNIDWNLEINDQTPLWVRSIAKKLEVAR
jgi:hypothetical protein